MKTRIVFLLGLFIAFSCEDEAVIADKEFTVVVESTADLACALPVIRFLDKAPDVKKSTKLETLTYNAYHLDDSLDAIGNTLIIEFTGVQDEELRACNTFGIAIPAVSIVKARLTN